MSNHPIPIDLTQSIQDATGQLGKRSKRTHEKEKHKVARLFLL